jgi:hypothetical protein
MLYLDRGCRPGDSGALVRLARTGEAVGIYTGVQIAQAPHTGDRVGLAQNMAQAVHALGVRPRQ